eukprot:scaffold818_cov136-Cylindrotheca_fusiformis.AAC.4
MNRIFLCAFLGCTSGFVIQADRPFGLERHLRLSYLDELDASRVGSSPRTIDFPCVDAESTALMTSLGLDDTVIRNEYGRWLARHGKSFDLTRYPQFKKNFVIQFQHDLEHGKFYTLNEFGDCTEEEYKQRLAKSQIPIPVTQQSSTNNECEIGEPNRASSNTQPQPVVVLAAEACKRALLVRFSAVAQNMDGESFNFLAEMVCRNVANGKKPWFVVFKARVRPTSRATDIWSRTGTGLDGSFI